jgi:hypothetical protein
VESWALEAERRTASGMPLRSTTRWYLEPGLPLSVGLRPVASAPPLARTLKKSTLARLQSIAAASPNQLRSVSCSRTQTPAASQSRTRRQHVVPLPQPSSWGNSRHGHPVRRRKVRPRSAARLGRRCRPPLGLGGSLGSRGSMASHRASRKRHAAFMAAHHGTPPRFCNTLSVTPGRRPVARTW